MQGSRIIVRLLRSGGGYAGLIIIAGLMLLPLLWLLSTALKSSQENLFLMPPQLLPQSWTWGHFQQIWFNYPFPRYTLNSLVVTGLAVLANLLLCSLAAYPLARVSFRGRRWVFGLILASLMIPFQVTLIPLYVLAVQFRLKNSYVGLVFPYLVSALGIFLLRQAMLGIPKELDEAAAIDGCSPVRIWWSIMLPAIRPDLVTLAIFIFVGVWGDFLWPLVMTDVPTLYTLPLGVATLASAFSSDWRLISAGSIISVLPVLMLFIGLQRYILPADVRSGIQG